MRRGGGKERRWAKKEEEVGPILQIGDCGDPRSGRRILGEYDEDDGEPRSPGSSHDIFKISVFIQGACTPERVCCALSAEQPQPRRISLKVELPSSRLLALVLRETGRRYPRHRHTAAASQVSRYIPTRGVEFDFLYLPLPLALSPSSRNKIEKQGREVIGVGRCTAPSASRYILSYPIRLYGIHTYICLFPPIRTHNPLCSALYRNSKIICLVQQNHRFLNLFP